MYRVSKNYFEEHTYNSTDDQLRDVIDQTREQGFSDAFYMTLKNQFCTENPFELTDNNKRLLINIYKPLLLLQGLKRNVG